MLTMLVITCKDSEDVFGMAPSILRAAPSIESDNVRLM